MEDLSRSDVAVELDKIAKALPEKQRADLYKTVSRFMSIAAGYAVVVGFAGIAVTKEASALGSQSKSDLDGWYDYLSNEEKKYQK